MALSPSIEVTTTREIRLEPQVKKKLKMNLEAYADLKLQRDAIDHAMKKHRDNIEGVMKDLGEDSLRLDGYTTTIVSSVRRKLEPKILLQLGVSYDIINEATVETQNKPYVKVTIPGGKDAADENL